MRARRKGHDKRHAAPRCSIVAAQGVADSREDDRFILVEQGATTASIKMRTEADHVTLIYRTQSNGSEWKPMEYPVYLEWTGCNLGGGGRGFSVRRKDVDGA